MSLRGTATSLAVPAGTSRILGIDPGSRVTGYGIIDSDGHRSARVASGCVNAGTGEFGARLERIFAGVQALVAEYRPTVVAIEKVFLHRNADSALKLGQARAAAICATFGAGIELHEYAPRAIKQALVGTGGADKTQVSHMVAAILGCRTSLAPDEADALAVALCHAHTAPLAARLGAVGLIGRARRVRGRGLRL